VIKSGFCQSGGIVKMSQEKSHVLFKKANDLLVGGVNSPVRSFSAVGGEPLFMERGQGPFIYDVDGNRYIDFVLSWGPLILGHRHEKIVEIFRKNLENGWTYGAPTSSEVFLAEEVLRRHEGLEKIRFVSSGTEATLSALRLARGVTGRKKIIKFSGCYHGHVDCLLVSAGSGLATLGQPDSAGLPSEVIENTFVLPYNDKMLLEKTLEEHASDIAAVIVEGVAGNMGVIPPQADFLEVLNTLPQKSGVLFILDEVMTGFRVGWSSAQGRYGLSPDIVTFGKVLGGGLPVGALAARAEIMDYLAPLGPVYQAGTLSGNPLAMAVGLATLRELDKKTYEDFERRGQSFVSSLSDLFGKYEIPHVLHQVGSMLGFFFSQNPVQDFEGASQSDTEFYGRFFHACLREGISLAPSAYEALFLSTCHDENILDETLQAMDQALARICASRSGKN
jgi:glutamate-1-semialdehyde 2,1-aminomutase